MKSPRIRLLLFGCVASALFLCAGVLEAQCLTARDAEKLFEQASALYRENDFAEAIRQYRDILDKGGESAAVYYNLGNSFAKLGQFGKALFYYEKASWLAPRDPDVRANREYVLSTLGIPGVAGPWGARNLGRLSRSLSQASLFFYLTFFNVLFFLLLGFSFVFPASRRWSRPAAVAALMLFLTAADLMRRQNDRRDKGALVIAPEAAARFGPSQEATTFFKLAEGAEVRVLETIGEWRKVRRADGKIGWVLRDALAAWRTDLPA